MTPIKPERAAFSVEEAAVKLGISRSLAWRMVREGALRSIRAGHRVIVPTSAVDEFLSKPDGYSPQSSRGIQAPR
jgi:excisionase family DNA binding protein